MLVGLIGKTKKTFAKEIWKLFSDQSFNISLVFGNLKLSLMLVAQTQLNLYRGDVRIG